MKTVKAIYTFITVFCCQQIFAQPLVLKQTFGKNGFAVTNLSNEAPHIANSMAQQSDGKLLLAGSTLTRLFINGNVDSSFGTNGLAFKAASPAVDAMTVQTDDKILCVYNDYYRVLIKRFTVAGSLDSSFGMDGIAAVFEPDKLFHVNSISLLLNGKIVVTGSCTVNGRSMFFVARFLTNGSADPTFNGTGRLILDLPAYDHVAYDMAEQSTGKIIIGGSIISQFGDHPQLALIRLNADGSRDMSFNATGMFQYSTASGSGEAAYLLQCYPDDKVLIAGNSNDKILLMRLQAQGGLDNSFSADGLLTEPGQGFSRARQLIIFNTNRILVTGHTSPINLINWNYAAFQFDAAGNADNSFNGNGKSILSFPGDDLNAGAVRLTDGSILMGGYNNSLVLPNTAKINAAGAFELSHGSNGIKFLRINGSDERIGKMLKQPDQKIIAIGNTNQQMNGSNHTLLTRYKTEGSVDSSFGTAGIVILADPAFVFHSALLQSDQKIILVGNKYAAAQNNIALMRLNSNGSIDNGFGAGGTVLLGSSVAGGYGNAAAILSNGSILVMGKDYVNANDILLFKLLNNGSMDNGFGTNGRKLVTTTLGETGLGSMILQADEKILMGGYAIAQNGLASFFCIRLLTTADLDIGFASNGIYRTPSSAFTFIELFSLLLSPGNTITLTGFVTNPSGQAGSVCVVKLLPGGGTDNSFNGTGINFYHKKLRNDSTYNFPYAAAVHPDSSLYVTGESVNVINEQQPFIIRIKQNGAIDSTLAADGSGWYPFGAANNITHANDIFINSTDTTIIVAGGKTAIGSNDDFLIAAYKRLPEVPGIMYVFNGNGLWTDAANWLNALVPPAILPNGASIYISPQSGGSCTLNFVQIINAGGKIVVTNGGRLVVVGDLKIGY